MIKSGPIYLINRDGIQVWNAVQRQKRNKSVSINVKTAVYTQVNGLWHM